jgi:uncharacterized protein with FMN-binding domain
MRRAVPALVATLGGLVLLANFHTASGAPHRIAVASVPTTTSPAGSSPPRPSLPGPTGPAHQQVDGPDESMQYGDVQVRVILTNGKITDVQPLLMPSDRRRSQEISQQVAPILHDEVLQAQSSQIDLVSGATYTSDAYQQSLQAALAKIGR